MFNSQFYRPKETEQKLYEIVDVTNWSIGGLNIYSEGARDKFVVESPNQLQFQFLIKNHKYLLKKTYIRKTTLTILHEQFWNEIIAYKVGRILKIPVPPAFVGCYKETNSEPFYGVLIEWFYDYGIEDTSKKGGDLIISYIDNYDTKKGKQHNFHTIKDICVQEKVEGWLKAWTETLLFDAIIANQDRHQDNWQIVQYSNVKRNYMSPAFDNGTSMGYNYTEEKMDSLCLVDYMDKGLHRMKWSLSDSKRAGHIELLEKLIYNFPETETYIKEKLATDISEISNDIYDLTKFEISDMRYKLTEKRADFIIKILFFRFNYIKKKLAL